MTCRIQPVERLVHFVVAVTAKNGGHFLADIDRPGLTILTVVSAVLSDAKRNEIIEKNPARMIDLPDTTRRVQMIPSDAEAHRFLDVLANEDSYIL